MANWRLRSLTFSNLFRYGGGQNLLDFGMTDKTFLIVGVNMDGEGVDSNGAGKSSIFDAIAWCLFGKTARSERFSDICRRGEQRASAIIELISGNDTVVVSRDKALDGEEELFFGINGVNHSLRLKSQTQVAIFKYFGLDPKKGFDDFLSQVYFSSTSSKGFLASDVDPIDRQQVLERFLHLDVLDKAVELARDDVKNIEVSRTSTRERIEYLSRLLNEKGTSDVLNAKLVDAVTDVEVLDRDIAETRSRVETVKGWLVTIREAKATVVEYVNKCTALTTEGERLEKRYADVKKQMEAKLAVKKQWEESQEELKKVQQEVNEYGEKAIELGGKLGGFDISLRELMTGITNAERDWRAVIAQKAGSITCPDCKAPLLVIGGEVQKMDLEKLRQEEKRLEGVIADLKSKKTTTANDRIAVETEMREVNLAKAKAFGRQSEIMQIGEQARAADTSELSRIEELQATNDALFKSMVRDADEKYEKYGALVKQIIDDAKKLGITIEEEKQATNVLSQAQLVDEGKQRTNVVHVEAAKSVVSSLKTLIEMAKKYEAEIKEAQLTLDESNKRHELAAYWVKMFGDIKGGVLTRFIPLFEAEVNRNLAKLGVTERVEFSLTSETKKGTLKRGFVIRVWDGKDYALFDVFSGGERSRILVAVGFALNNLAARKSGQRFDFTLCDELLDNLDGTGMEYFFRLQEQMTGQKFIITHAKPDVIAARCDKRIIVTRNLGVSTCLVS